MHVHSRVDMSRAGFRIVRLARALGVACGALGLAYVAACSSSDSGGDAGAGGHVTGGGGSTSAAGGASGTAGTGGAAAGGGGGSSGTGGSSSAMANPAPGGKLFVGVNFWRVDWSGSDEIFQNGVDFATTMNPWRPELISDLSPFKVIRFMDWNLTNDSNNPQASFSTRKQKTDSQSSDPVAFEWQVDLCNRAKTDCWLTMPHEANLTDYATQLAQLVHGQLSPDLRVYIEWSNEVWNGGFPQHAYAADRASNLGLPGGDGAASYQVYASVRMFEQFESVFGKGSPRLVKVLSGQQAWDGPCTDAMAALKDGTINPNGTMPDVFAVAPYFGGVSISELQSAIPALVSGMSQNQACATGNGLPLVSYEGGSDSFAAPNGGCASLALDPGMHDLYTSYLDMLSGTMHGPFMQYTGVGSCWGLKQHTGDSPANAPKYKGVVDWLSAHP